MSQLNQFQDYIRNNGKKLTGLDIPVVLSNEDAKSPSLKFTFGWTVEISVSKHDHGSYCPSGINAGSTSNAYNSANRKAKDYVSGQNPLFNETFQNMLSNDVAKDFLIKDNRLGSAPETYVGSDPCYSCHGSGKKSCYGCHGSGKTSCSGCNGSGRVNVSRYDSYQERTVHTTESCSSCWGRGNQTCSACSGCGSITCSTCNGGGYLYCSYSIDGDAKRSTEWLFKSNDYHGWTERFIIKKGLHIVQGLSNITEIDVEGAFGGCTFIYAFTANLPTLQYQATIDKVSTEICFAGTKNITHDAGGVYDPAVWRIGQKLGNGSQSHDIKALATPAIKQIIEANESNSNIALLDENWVSTDIKDAVLSNYQTLIQQLKKQSVKGIVPNMLAGLVKSAYFFFTIGMLIALLFPAFAEDTKHRMSVTQVPEWMMALLSMEFRLFGLPALANYALALGLLWISYKSVKKYYWKKISKTKNWILAIGLTLLLPHICFSLYYNTMEILRLKPAITDAIVAGSLFVGLYLLVIGVKWPEKWYTKLFGLIVGAGLYCALQYTLFMVNPTYGFIDNHANYPKEIASLLTTAARFMESNLAEWCLLSAGFAYFLTKRKFWLKAKDNVSDYYSTVLLKSMNMEK